MYIIIIIVQSRVEYGNQFGWATYRDTNRLRSYLYARARDIYRRYNTITSANDDHTIVLLRNTTRI